MDIVLILFLISAVWAFYLWIEYNKDKTVFWFLLINIFLVIKHIVWEYVKNYIPPETRIVCDMGFIILNLFFVALFLWIIACKSARIF